MGTYSWCLNLGFFILKIFEWVVCFQKRFQLFSPLVLFLLLYQLMDVVRPRWTHKHFSEFLQAWRIVKSIPFHEYFFSHLWSYRNFPLGHRSSFCVDIRGYWPLSMWIHELVALVHRFVICILPHLSLKCSVHLLVVEVTKIFPLFLRTPWIQNVLSSGNIGRFNDTIGVWNRPLYARVYLREVHVGTILHKRILLRHLVESTRTIWSEFLRICSIKLVHTCNNYNLIVNCQ